MPTKRLLAITLLIAAVGLVGYALYAVFFSAPTETVTPPVNGGVNGTGGSLPPAGTGGTGAVPGTGGALPSPGTPTTPGGASVTVQPTVSTVADGGVTLVTPIAVTSTVGASVGTNGNLNYYSRDDGKFYRRSPDGTVTALSGKTFYNVDKAVFDPAGNRAILSYPDGAKTMYDFGTGTQVTLPKHWEDFQWAPEGGKIISKSLALDKDSRFLVVASPDGSGAKAIQELGDNANKVTVAWSPTNQVVALSATGEPCGFACEEIFLIGQNKENFKTIKAPGLGFTPQWTPSGKQLLFSVANDTSDWRPQLWIVDAEGDNIGANRRSINLNTWADKCAFADDTTLYCAVPREIPRGAGLNRAVTTGTPDDLYSVNLATGLTRRIAVPEGNRAMTNLQLSPNGQDLYFADGGTGFLYSIKLK